MEHTQWDAVVIGGGAAGLSAAQMLGRARRRTLVLDAGSPRNRFTAHMHGVLGHDGVAPADLLSRGRAEVERYGVVVRAASVTRVDELADRVVVALEDGTSLTTRALIVASGITDELPDVPGLIERWGSTVLHCPYCHGWEVRGRRLGVLLVSPLQAHQAQLVRQWSDHVVVFAHVPLTDDAAARLRARGVEIVDEPVVEVRDGEVVLLSGRVMPVDAIFTMSAARPHDTFLAHLGLARAETPFGDLLTVDAAGKTSSARIWAAGNVVSPAANVPLAMGAGAMAGAAVNGALVEEDGDAAVSSGAEVRGAGAQGPE
ncbi:NAD(P)/FAD-dependent oxidoreductase [Planococcus sp. APC 4015]|nr:NAD(P)/FAD-dependent oxidoreductase [Planococcus sp. APC 4015]